MAISQELIMIETSNLVHSEPERKPKHLYDINRSSDLLTYLNNITRFCMVLQTPIFQYIVKNCELML